MLNLLRCQIELSPDKGTLHVLQTRPPAHEYKQAKARILNTSSSKVPIANCYCFDFGSLSNLFDINDL